MPLDHDNPELGSFSYRYQFIQKHEESTSQRVIINIPGGPGQNMIGSSQEADYLVGFNHIEIDPRSIGCNFVDSSKMSSDLITTDQHARDIAYLIKNLEIEDYAIHGVSYGTVVATYLSHLAGQDPDLLEPTAVVLEGVVGQAIKGDVYARSFATRWQETTELVPGLMGAFANQKELPFGYDINQWNAIIRTLLSIGGPEGRSWLEAAVNPDYYDKNKVTKVFDSLLEDGTNIQGEQRFYLEVGCKELFENTRYFNFLTSEGFEVFDFADFLAEGVSLEEAIQVCNTVDLERPFNPNDYVMVDVPTYYFQGTMDPNTTYKESLIHREAQGHLTQAFYIDVQDAGHNPLGVQLKKCQGSVWNSIFEGVKPWALLATGYCYNQRMTTGVMNQVGNFDVINEKSPLELNLPQVKKLQKSLR